MHTPTLPKNRGISSLHKKKEHEFKEAWLDLHHCARHKDGQCMYQVSNYGNVRMKTKDGYITVKQRLNPNGYTPSLWQMSCILT